MRLVPLPNVGALAALPALRVVRLSQMAPVSEAQASALARCAGVTRLELEPLPWELLPAIGKMRLRALGLALRAAPRGALPPRAADALLALGPLSRLRAFRLEGQGAARARARPACRRRRRARSPLRRARLPRTAPRALPPHPGLRPRPRPRPPVELCERHVTALAAAWPALRSLDLCCGLGQGTSGFGAFGALRRLRLSPFAWDIWSAEPPLLLHPAELPRGLTSLEARDCWVAPPGPEAAALAAAPSSDFSWGAGVCPCPCPAAAAAAAAAAEELAAAAAGGSGDERVAPPGGSGGGDAAGSGGGGGAGARACGECRHAQGGRRRSMQHGVSEHCSPFVAAVAGSCWLGPDGAASDSSGSGASGSGSGNDGGAAPLSPRARSAAAAPPTAPVLSAAARAAALTLPSAPLRRLALRCIGGAALRGPDGPSGGAAPEGGGALALPVLSELSCLEGLDLHYSCIEAADLDQITCAPFAPGLRSLRLVVADDGARRLGSALTRLTRLGGIECLQARAHASCLLALLAAAARVPTASGPPAPPCAPCVAPSRAPPALPPRPARAAPRPQLHTHERALGRRVLAAIASMDSLRRLTIVTRPDFPATFASGLLVLTRLRQLSELRVGLGFGALDALKRLRAAAARALPDCRFTPLPDADSLLREEEGGAAPGYAAGYAAPGEPLYVPPRDYGPAAQLASFGGTLGGGGGGGGDGGRGREEPEDLIAPAAPGGGAALGHGPRYVRLVRASWAG